MLDIKAWQEENGEVAVKISVEGFSNNLCDELCSVVAGTLEAVLEEEEPETAEKLELATISAIVADFIERKTGKKSITSILAISEFLGALLYVEQPEGEPVEAE